MRKKRKSNQRPVSKTTKDVGYVWSSICLWNLRIDNYVIDCNISRYRSKRVTFFV